MKVKNIKSKVAAKVAKGKKKVAAKCGKGKPVKACAFALLLATILAGCGTTTPSRSQSLTIKDCTINVYGCGTETNEVARVELATQAMSIENSGTESQTAAPQYTTDIKPDVNLNYAQGGGISNRGTGGTNPSWLDELTSESAALVKSYITGKKSGTLTVKRKDGSTATVECKDGECGECSDCAE